MKMLGLIFCLFSTVSYADVNTACVGPNMQWAEAYMRYFENGAKQANVGPYASYYRSRQCDADDNCNSWQKVALQRDATDSISLIKGAGRKIQVEINYYGKKIQCGLVGENLACKDPNSYLSYTGVLTNHCFRLLANESRSVNDDKGNYDDGEDILFGEF